MVAEMVDCVRRLPECYWHRSYEFLFSAFRFSLVNIRLIDIGLVVIIEIGSANPTVKDSAKKLVDRN